MPEIANITAADLAIALPPGEPDLTAADLAPALARRVAFFDTELARVADVTAVLDAWQGRLDRVPPPPQPQTLQELVEAARHRLRRQRLTLDRTALERKAGVLAEVRLELLR